MNELNLKSVLKTKEAAEYIGASESSLRQSRMNGARENRMSSPPFYRLGRSITYRKEDLDQWLAIHRIDLSQKETE